ncbi:MAG: site-specific DNA-methyltransferase [Bacteroidaceae bacterium]|nr:site-specific DNA-methyltransferase [Bacteroidaceae bacterium]MBO7588152.1 site-specific DNA-methyltransferase [Bacteroidaceae bacterium]
MPTHHILINGDSRKMSQIQDESVGLIVTSPPYWQLKDYGADRQIGFNQSYEDYINHLNLVWSECYRILQPGCRLCINIGDQFARTAYYGRYKIVPIHSEIIRFCETVGFDYMGTIIWQKQTTMHTTGGERVMGSYPYPRGGIVKVDYENILLFKKQGKAPSVDKSARETSKLTDEEWNTFFSSHWNFPGAKQTEHIAVFPEELPNRLIKMYSFVGDTVCDPFMGSGTTALAAMKLERNSVGYEINSEFRRYYHEKLTKNGNNGHFEFYDDNNSLNTEALLESLPYRFVDVHQIERQVDVKQRTYGSKFEIDDSEKTKNKDFLNSEGTASTVESTVMVNHARPDLYKRMIETGICYLRAGDSKGSLLVTPGFERLNYVLLHTNGENAQLFKLKTKGHFQIWTRETLQQYGFEPRSAAYYVVLHFDSSKTIPMIQHPDLHEGVYTYCAKIMPLSVFIK